MHGCGPLEQSKPDPSLFPKRRLLTAPFDGLCNIGSNIFNVKLSTECVFCFACFKVGLSSCYSYGEKRFKKVAQSVSSWAVPKADLQSASQTLTVRVYGKFFTLGHT